MTMTPRDQEEQELRIEILLADLDLKRKRGFWETPKALAIVVGIAVTVIHLDAPLAAQIVTTAARPAPVPRLPAADGSPVHGREMGQISRPTAVCEVGHDGPRRCTEMRPTPGEVPGLAGDQII